MAKTENAETTFSIINDDTGEVLAVDGADLVAAVVALGVFKGITHAAAGNIDLGTAIGIYDTGVEVLKGNDQGPTDVFGFADRLARFVTPDAADAAAAALVDIGA